MTPKKMKFIFIFFILTQKVLVRLLLYLTCKLLLNRGYNVNQDGPSLIIQAPPPPPPPGPHVAKDVHVFTYCPPPWLPLFFLVVHMYPVWWCLRDSLVPLDSTYASPRPPKMKQKFEKNSSDYFHILHIVEFWCDFKMFVGPWSIYIYIYIYKMFMSSVDQCILI